MTTLSASAPSSLNAARGLGAAKRVPMVDARRCAGCGGCVAVCDVHLLSLEVRQWRKTAVLSDADPCTGCSACAAACPFRAIVMQARQSRAERRSV